MPDPLSHLGGLKIGAEEFLTAVLRAAAQPIWVVDRHGTIRVANPAAFAALGYDDASELLGRNSHATIHYKRPDGSPYPASECPMLLPRTTGETVARELDWFFRRDGSMFAVSYVSVPLDLPDGRGAVVAFTDLDARLRREGALREREAALTEEHASLRRLAVLAAGGAPSAEVFSAAAEEVARVMHIPMVLTCRIDADRAGMTVIGAWSDRPHQFQVGTRWSLDGDSLSSLVLRTGRPARINYGGGVPGPIAASARESGVRSAVGAPIVVDGEIWGAMVAGSPRPEPLPEHAPDRLADFTALVATAISGSQARGDLRRVVDEQAALRRLATLVAQGAEPQEVFDAVCEETGRVLGASSVNLAHFTPDGFNVTVAGWSLRDIHVPAGTRLPLDGESINRLVRDTAAPAHLDDYANASGALSDLIRRLGLRSEAGAPVVVEGRVWGALIAGTDEPDALAGGTEHRLASFAELIATAVSNATARSELVASRVRIVEAADDQRRRVVRDLHDGAQQRLVHTVITLKLARDSLGEDAASELVEQALEHAQQATNELRELAHGILPAALTSGGLRTGLDALASRMPVPVDLEVPSTRFAASVEATAYFVVAEALTNVSKHARAERAWVVVHADGGFLHVRVRDDGVGGAQTAGPGLLGMKDRLAALEGDLRIDSPPGEGTQVAAAIPLRD